VPQSNIISLVPSWTETLLSAGVPLAGRSRFCIEPKSLVQNIPVMGGTKDWDLPRINALKPATVILDQEENPKFMSEVADLPFIATHVKDLASCAAGLDLISRGLRPELSAEAAVKLQDFSNRWRRQANRTKPLFQFESPGDWTLLPGVLDWIRLPERRIENILYLIWKKPWMVATRETFIGSVLSHSGVELQSCSQFSDNKYPQIQLENYDPLRTLLLFSSEPYPFERRKEEVRVLPFASAIVDGQSFSWFGIRSLNFLESLG
jgi:hypothetical protein